MHDIIIIGGGPAGIAAAIYSARAGRDTLLIESTFLGGQITLSETIENYPGLEGAISGYQLASRMEKQARVFGAKILNGKVEGFEFDNKIKTVKTAGETYQARAVILSMGVKTRRLGLPDEDRFTGAGVSYCATCDGSFFKDKEVAVIGGGDTAAEEALYLARLCSRVYIVHRRDSLRASSILQDRVFENEKIQVVWDSVAEGILGRYSVEGLRVKNVKTGAINDIGVNGIFVAIGSAPQTDMLEGLVDLSDDGYIITDDRMRTSVPGVFAAGDIRNKELRQVVTAVSDGAVAAHSASQYLNE